MTGLGNLPSHADETIAFANRLELLRNSRLSESALIVVGHEHRLYDALSVDECMKAIQDDQWFVP